MGVSTDGILVFGIDLGEEIPEFLESYDGDFDLFIDENSGLPTSGPLRDYKKLSENRDAFPIEMTRYCSYEYPMYILGVKGKHYQVDRGDVVVVNTEDLTVRPDQIETLMDFCEQHNIEWQEPKWLLVSMWG